MVYSSILFVSHVFVMSRMSRIAMICEGFQYKVKTVLSKKSALFNYPVNFKMLLFDVGAISSTSQKSRNSFIQRE